MSAAAHLHSLLDPAMLAHAGGPDSILSGFDLRHFHKGALLSTPGSARNQVFIVHSGRLRVYLAGADRELNVSFLEAGDIYTTHTPMYLQAAAPTALWMMDTRTFALKLADDPSINPMVMRVIGRLLSNAVTLIEDLAFREVPARLARFLIGLAERRGKQDDTGWLVALELSMEDIAGLLGTTRQTVSLLMNQWQREGILQRPGRHSLLICSLDRLAQYCLPPE